MARFSQGMPAFARRARIGRIGDALPASPRGAWGREQATALRLAIFGLAASCTACPASAQELWHGIAAGMTIAQVKRVVPDATEVVLSPDKQRQADAAQIAQGKRPKRCWTSDIVEIFPDAYELCIGVDVATHRVISVSLVALAATAEAYPNLKAFLSAQYGALEREECGDVFCSAFWNPGAVSIRAGGAASLAVAMVEFEPGKAGR